MKLLQLRGKVSPRQRWILGIAGLLFILLIWVLLTAGQNPIVSPRALPKPFKVFTAFGELFSENNLIRNSFFSIGLNLAGYIEAILISVPIGFAIGLYPLFKGMFQSQVDAIRYIPLTALIGIFIVWFGTQTPMKYHFLAFGIIIYMLPVIVQRINDVKDVYLKTVYTLGASDWQTIKSVYFPAVMSKFMDDIRVLTAISWTYIIVIEGVGSEGGLGDLIYRVGQRQARIDKVFAILLLIIVIGMLTDRMFIALDKTFFPHKYQQSDSEKYSKVKEDSYLEIIGDFAVNILVWVLIALYLVAFINEFTGMISAESKIFAYLFKDASWAIHTIAFSLIGYKGWNLYRKFSSNRTQKIKTTVDE